MQTAKNLTIIEETITPHHLGMIDPTLHPLVIIYPTLHPIMRGADHQSLNRGMVIAQILIEMGGIFLLVIDTQELLADSSFSLKESSSLKKSSSLEKTSSTPTLPAVREELTATGLEMPENIVIEENLGTVTDDLEKLMEKNTINLQELNQAIDVSHLRKELQQKVRKIEIKYKDSFATNSHRTGQFSGFLS